VPTVVRLMAAIAIGVVSFAGVATARESSPPSESCTLGIGGSVVSVRQTVLLSTAGCKAPYAAGASIGITFASTQVSLGTATADGNGQLSASVTIPTDASRGEHTISASGPRPDGSARVLTVRVMVVVPGATVGASAGELAFTGSDALPFVWIALVALVLGSALVIGARRRATVRARQESSGP